MRSFFAAVLAALALAAGASLPAAAFTGANLRETAASDPGARLGYEGTQGARLHLARAAVDSDEAKPTHRWRREGRLERRRYAKPRHVRSAKRSWNRARKHAGKHRHVARAAQRTLRHAVRPARRAAVQPVAAGSGITGAASFYGGRFHGRLTASGARFDSNGMTAAHRSLPFGTRVRVTHLGSGRSVDVRINDRGPFIGGRIIDLSRGAAGVLGMHNQGVAQVRVTVLSR